MFSTLKKLIVNYLSQYRRLKYTKAAKKQIKKYGIDLRVNHPCIFSGHIEVGDHCNFNGMRILGGGCPKT